MSSLRRRAIVVSRARSAERSSTGGRVSARAAAAESSGSASTRSQAIASRTSGRWKSAAGPERWKGMPRSSIAAATGPPSRAGSSTSTQISSGEVPVAEQVLDLARHRLRLRPLVACSARSAAAASRNWLLERDHVAARVDLVEPGGVVALERVDVLLAAPPLPASAGEDRPLGRRSPPRARRPSRAGSGRRSRSRTSARSCEQPAEGEEDVAAVEAAGVGEDPVVGGAELGQLGLGRVGAGLQLRRSAPAGGRAGRPGCRGSRWLRSGSSSRRSSSIARRSARPSDVEEGVEPRRVGVLAQQPLAESPPRCRSRAPRRGRRAASRPARAGAGRWPRVEAMTRTRSGAEPSAASRRRAAPAPRSCPSRRCRPAAAARSSQAIARCCGSAGQVHRPTLARRSSP